MSIFSFALFACNNTSNKETIENTKTQASTTSASSSIENGEKTERFPNGVIRFQGMIKNGKRDGLWKSFYESGAPWSETTYSNGLKNGPTKVWFENGTMRYEGFFTDDNESGNWIFYDDKGNIAKKQSY